MNRSIFTRTMIESFAGQALLNIQEDPKRAIRKAADLGMQFSKGRFQKYFFRLAQTMLENEESEYYTMITRLTQNTDWDTLKTFCINIGFESWTSGAQKIRNIKAKEGHDIPWTIFFQLNRGGTVAPQEYQRLVTEGKKLGICCFQFFLEQGAEIPDFVISLAQKEKKCAFLLFLHPGSLNETSVERIAGCHNILTAVCSEDEDWEDAVDLLRGKKCLYGVYRNYSDAAVKETLSGEWVDKAAEKLASFAFCVADPCGSGASEPAVRSCVLTARTQQKYPLLLIDLYSDILYVDEIISSSRRCVRVDGDGGLSIRQDGNWKKVWDSITSVSLTDLLTAANEDASNQKHSA